MFFRNLRPPIGPMDVMPSMTLEIHKIPEYFIFHIIFNHLKKNVESYRDRTPNTPASPVSFGMNGYP